MCEGALVFFCGLCGKRNRRLWSAGATNKYRLKRGSALPIQIHALKCDGVDVTSNAAFISAVEAQRGKKITNAQADQLTAAAQEIRALLSCGN